MNLGPVTKLDKRNKTVSKKFGDDVMSENCDFIVIFRIFGQFGAVRRPDSGHRVYESYVFSKSNLFVLQKLKIELKNLQHSSHTIDLSKGTFLDKKR